MELRRLGKYEIRGTLGKGAMGTVYDGFDSVIDRRVAIKTMNLPDPGDAEAQDELHRFRREAQAAGRLTHPNIVAVYDYGEDGPIAYIVMEYAPGTELKKFLDKGERLPPAEALRIMDGVLAGLQYSHERGVVHRDIKPGNVILSPDGTVKIADFGIARIESSSMTQAGTVMGTPAYMSPEQFMGQTVNARTDLYSAGVMLYQLLTGERPFEGSMSAIMHKALNTVPSRPSDLSVTAPPALDAVVARAMAKRPEDRFESALAFAQAIKTAMSGGGMALIDPLAGDDATLMQAPPRPRPAAAPPPKAEPAAAVVQVKRSKAPVFAGIGVLVVALAGVGGYMALGGKSSDPGTPASSIASSGQLTASTSAPPATLTPQANPSTPPAASPQGGGVAALSPPPAEPTKPAPTPATPNPTVAASPAPRPTAPSAQTPPVSSPPVSSPSVSSPSVSSPSVSSPSVSATSPSTQAPAAAAQAPSAAPTQATSSGPSASQPAAAIPLIQLPAIPQAPPPQPPAQVAIVLPTPGVIRDAIAASLRNQSCSLTRTTLQGRSVIVSGLASRGAEAAVQRAARDALPPNAAVDSYSMRLDLFDGPYCDILDTIRPVSSKPVGLSLRNNARTLRKDDDIVPTVVMPDTPSYLLVDYFSSDGGLSHLHPTTVTPARQEAARSTVVLGNTAKERWQVDAPFGTDMIVAIASSQPLFSEDRPADDTTPSYLAALRDALDAAVRNGVAVSANIIPVQTTPR